jgi:hypothetical protein
MPTLREDCRESAAWMARVSTPMTPRTTTQPRSHPGPFPREAEIPDLGHHSPMAVRRSASFTGLAFAAALVASVPAAGSTAAEATDAASIADSGSIAGPAPAGVWAGIVPSHVPPPPDELVPLASGVEATATLPRWTGGVNLYRPGVFSTQKTWIWCTAAGAQISRNIVLGRTDHSRASQKRYFRYMRAHQRYQIPLADGVDPTGWAAGLRRWVDPRYRVVASGGYRKALRSAVTSLRKTNLPVGIAVARGAHAWVLTGFAATADPAKTSRFEITSVRVTGPLWGRQNRSFGYDMRPNTRLTRAQLRRFFTPWHYAPITMAWEGRWLAIQPVLD